MVAVKRKTTKELEVVAADFGMKKIQFKGGGQLPSMLQGLFTSEHEAKKLINVYLEVR